MAFFIIVLLNDRFLFFVLTLSEDFWMILYYLETQRNIHGLQRNPWRCWSRYQHFAIRIVLVIHYLKILKILNMKRKNWRSAINLVTNAYTSRDLDSIITPKTYALETQKTLKFFKLRKQDHSEPHE